MIRSSCVRTWPDINCQEQDSQAESDLEDWRSSAKNVAMRRRISTVHTQRHITEQASRSIDKVSIQGKPLPARLEQRAKITQRVAHGQRRIDDKLGRFWLVADHRKLALECDNIVRDHVLHLVFQLG